jgi:hypothetical protein
MTALARTQGRAVNPATGEVIDLAERNTGELAQALDGLHELRGALARFQGQVEDELLARMDAQAHWTERVEQDGRVYELRAPSPSAGETFRGDLLEESLRALVAEGTIDEAAAERACKRSLSVTLLVPWSADTGELRQHLTDAQAVNIGEASCRVESVRVDAKPILSGLSALRKLPGVAEVIEGARSEETPARRVRLKVS